MVRGRHLALQLVREGSFVSAGARPYRRVLGFNVSTGKILCCEAKHMVERDIGIASSPIASKATHDNQDISFSRISMLLKNHGDSGVVPTFGRLEGQCIQHGRGHLRLEKPNVKHLVRSLAVSNKYHYLDHSSRQWPEFRQRGISSSQQAMSIADKQKAALVSQHDDDAGGQGQLPPSQPPEETLMLTSEEEKISSVMARSDLLITRNVEWANLALGFEQQNKYVIMDPHQPQAPVGFIVEESNVLLRQVLRTKRPFAVSVLDANGEEVCRVRRPAFLINSSMFVETNGKVIGECHRRWHLWKRIYDVYRGNKQFATVENPGFWNWTFTLTDDSGGILAEIDRNWRGFGFEFLTDAGQYVVRFGDALPNGSIRHATPVSEEVVDRKPFLLSKSEKTGSTEIQQLQEAADQVDALAVARPLSLIERAVVLALAVSLDNDYFSRHSHSGVGMPLPIPFYTSEAVAAEDSPAESSNAESETGHEVFPSQGLQGSQTESTAGDREVSNDANEDVIADDPFFGMFDEPDSGDQDNDNQYFDDPPDSGDSWGLSDWGLGGDGDS